ncbi:hypothetical protein LP419_01875 [Massilia sp. H-1]|nr:hypothetical protein LP419_01875 [Massilia sp. H-1]
MGQRIGPYLDQMRAARTQAFPFALTGQAHFLARLVAAHPFHHVEEGPGLGKHQSHGPGNTAHPVTSGSDHSGRIRTSSPFSTLASANRFELAAIPAPAQAMRASRSGELAASLA